MTNVMRFEGGPLDGETRFTDLPWPLPDEMAAPSGGLRGRYLKVAESQLPDEDLPGVIRGASYRWEEGAGRPKPVS